MRASTSRVPFVGAKIVRDLMVDFDPKFVKCLRALCKTRIHPVQINVSAVPEAHLPDGEPGVMELSP